MFFQDRLQPLCIFATGSEILLQNAPIVDEDHRQCHIILNIQSHLCGGGRLVAGPGQDGKLTRIFQNGVFDLRDAGDSLTAQFF